MLMLLHKLVSANVKVVGPKLFLVLEILDLVLQYSRAHDRLV